MNSEPKVLVFASCYNHEKYVAESIESVLDQTYRNLEFLIVNDGSTDNSASIIEKYTGDTRLVFVNLQENTSAVGAFEIINDYICQSDAKYVAGMSTDDKWKAEKLEKQVLFLENNPSFKACFTWDEILIEEVAEGKVGLPMDYSHHRNKDRFKNLHTLIRYSNFYNAVSAVTLREVFVELGGYNWAYRNLQDYDLWIRMQFKYSVYLMNDALTYYRRHESNLSMSSNTYMRDRNEHFFILDKIMREIDDYTFKKIFFGAFVYYNSSTHTEITAEKIVMLLRDEDMLHKQVAFSLYYENSTNKELRKLLKEKYELDDILFHKLTGAHGLEFVLLDYKPEVQYVFNKMEALFNFIDNGGTYYDLKALKYNALKSLIWFDYNTNKNIESYTKIKNYIWSYQDKYLGNGKKLLVVLDEYLDEYKDNAGIFDDIDYIAVIPGYNKIFMDNSFEEPEIYTEAEQITLFDRENHCLKAIWELGELNIDSIILYGFSEEDYILDDIIDNVSLATKLYTYTSVNGKQIASEKKYLIREY